MNNRTRCLGLLITAVLFFGCSANRPLSSRGLNSEERRHYIIQNGYGIPNDIKNSFLEGFPFVGMDQELIFQLYGAPDRTKNDDTEWEYVNGRGDLITGFKFENKKTVEILGDPRGGLPVEGKK
jgi:hypothetical protein